MSTLLRLSFIAAIPAMLGACSTVSLPKVDFMKLPEFKDEAKITKEYPDVAAAPDVPTDVRSDAAWDTAARKLISARDNFKAPNPSTPEMTEAEIAAQVRALRAKVQEYKLDDPQ